MSMPKSRILFCSPTTALSGGIKVIFEIAARLAASGHTVHIFSYAGNPQWHPLDVAIIPQKDLGDVPFSTYDFVLVSNAFFVPMVIPLLGGARGVFFCQDYESFHHARGKRFEDFLADDPTFMEIYRLPIPIITVSRGVQRLIDERIGRSSHYVPVGFNKEIFRPRERLPNSGPTGDYSLAMDPLSARLSGPRRRILMVGNYLSPYKGMPDAFQALSILAGQFPVELVMVTQESRSRSIFEGLPYPVELHHCPRERDMPGIMATCDAYCCSSWYEGLGLPGLEAFHCGLPVVSTRDYGVGEYGVEGVNLLLAQPNDPEDLADKLARVLTDSTLASRLREGGYATVADRYHWDISLVAMESALDAIAAEYEVPDVDAAAMADLVRQLEQEGSVTPIETFRRFNEVSVTLRGVCDRTAATGEVSPADVTELDALSEELRTYTENPASEYYRAFKAKLDLARLIRSLTRSQLAGTALRKIIDRTTHDEPRNPAALREIQYSNP